MNYCKGDERKMKELTAIPAVYLQGYDVEVNPYLTIEQIQQIVEKLTPLQSWAEREQTKNVLILYHATNIGKDVLGNTDYDILHTSGLIDAVIGQVRNIDQIDEAVQWTESTQRALGQIVEKLPELLAPLKEKVDLYAGKKRK